MVIMVSTRTHFHPKVATQILVLFELHRRSGSGYQRFPDFVAQVPADRPVSFGSEVDIGGQLNLTKLGFGP